MKLCDSSKHLWKRSSLWYKFLRKPFVQEHDIFVILLPFVLLDPLLQGSPILLEVPKENKERINQGGCYKLREEITQDRTTEKGFTMTKKLEGQVLGQQQKTEKQRSQLDV